MNTFKRPSGGSFLLWLSWVTLSLAACSSNVNQTIPGSVSAAAPQAVTQQAAKQSALVVPNGPGMGSTRLIALSALPIRAPRPDEVEAFLEISRDFPELAGLPFVALDGTTNAEPSSNDLQTAGAATSNPYICGKTVNGHYYNPSWNGNTPPNCTPTGIFRRVFSSPATEAAGGFLTLPSASSGPITLPQGPAGGKGDAAQSGFIYIEGWPGANAPNSEAGLGWAASTQQYNPYIAANNPGGRTNFTYGILPQTGFWLRVGAVSNPKMTTTTAPMPRKGQPVVPKGTSCSSGCIALTLVYRSADCPRGTPQNGVCTDVERILAGGWSQNCCIFGRVTSIASETPYEFLGGYEFGSISWTNAKTDYYPSNSPTPGQGVPFAYAGAQNYPNSSSFVRVTESDTADEVDSLFNPTSY